MNKKYTSIIVAAALVIAALCSYQVYAVYIMQSNTVLVTSQTQAVMTLTVNSTAPIVGVDKVLLTVTEPSLTGQAVTFYDGTSVVGVTASSAGTATLVIPIIDLKTFEFHATANHP